ncbi:MAG: MFS transporter, partial [Cyclobacteriaceae bacterium]
AVAGSLGDKLGRVKVFKTGILIFTISSLLCGISPDIHYLIIFRTLQGIGGSLMIPGSLSIISAVFSKDEKGKAIGTWSAATTIVMICGPVLGGALADAGFWRYIFYINIPLGIFAFFVLHFKVPESLEPGASKIDWTGAILLILSLTLLTFGFLEMPELGFSNIIVLASLAVGTCLFVAFLFVENKVAEPMIPLSLFKNKVFSGVNLLSFFLYAGLGGMMLFLSLNLIQIQGYSQLQAGITFLPFSFMMVVMGRKMGSLTDKYGPERFLMSGPLLAAAGMIGLAMIGKTAGPSDYWTTYFPWFVLFAFGMSVTVVPLTTLVMSSVADNQSGIASGINNSVTRIAGTFINALLGAFAIYLFSGFVSGGISTLALSESLVEMTMAEAVNLGEATAGNSFPAEVREVINETYDSSFLQTYKLVGLFSGALAILAAVIAFITLRKDKTGLKNTTGA